MRVKICGITSVEDAEFVCASGVDAIGLVFYEKSPRYVDIATAQAICDSLPPFVTIVGLFLNASSQFVQKTLQQVPLDLLQFHGTETPAFCQQFFRPYIKAVGMKNAFNFENYANQYPNAKGFLLDSHKLGVAGGTGQTFDWSKVPVDYPKPIIIAGGLNPHNIMLALKTLPRVYGLDLSSGVESKPGKKNHNKVINFMNAIKKHNALSSEISH